MKSFSHDLDPDLISAPFGARGVGSLISTLSRGGVDVEGVVEVEAEILEDLVLLLGNSGDRSKGRFLTRAMFVVVVAVVDTTACLTKRVARIQTKRLSRKRVEWTS